MIEAKAEDENEDEVILDDDVLYDYYVLDVQDDDAGKG